MWVCVSISPGSTVTSAGKLMTVAPAGGLPPLVTLSILLPLINTNTLCRTWFDSPSIRFEAWIATTFSGTGLPFGCAAAVCAVAIVTRVEANSRITHRMALRLNIENSYQVIKLITNTPFNMNMQFMLEMVYGFYKAGAPTGSGEKEILRLTSAVPFG